jgi:hypothetical protein
VRGLVGPRPQHRAGDALASVRRLDEHRGWSEEEWASAAAHLEQLGWVENGRLTVDGQRARADVEVVTDAAARKPWSALSPEEAERTAELLEPIARSVWASGVVPTTNPVGVGAP